MPHTPHSPYGPSSPHSPSPPYALRAAYPPVGWAPGSDAAAAAPPLGGYGYGYRPASRAGQTGRPWRAARTAPPGRLPARARRPHRRIPGPISVLLLVAGLATLAVMAVTAPLRVLRGPEAGRQARPRRRRRGAAPTFVLAALAIAGMGTLAVAVAPAYVGAHLPGSRRVHALLDRMPQPWKPPRLVYVPLPAAADLAALAAPAAGGPAGAANAAGDAAAAPRAQASQPPAEVVPAPAAWKLEGFRHQWQTWNNCGPATITMAASHFGRTETQAHAAAFLKPNASDKNVNPHELVAYARSLGLEADWRVGGDLNRLKLLLANGIPVVAQIWYAPEPNDWMGHYRLLVGYDDGAGQFVAYDSYQAPGRNLRIAYGRFDAEWRVFNRTYVPVYSPDRAPVVARILGRDRDDRAMYEHALAVAQGEAAAQPDDAFAWFNVGTNLVALGLPSEAVPAFDRARSLKLPYRMLWYQFGPFEAYLAEGRLGDVLTLAGATLARTSDLEEAHYYRGRALQAQGQTAGARAAFQAALKVNARYAPAYHALATLG